ncbi:MAG TPA: ATP-binding cassette domain-containing protein [Candidatus Dojkabacteria bacterium]|nr:ATP-binding cassette domain-containing protein [Candidatus Dojkabacteria bacterium]
MLNTKTLIQFQNIELSFNDKQILNNVSGAILQGNIIGLIGINGSGKSSLLKLISGIKQPDAGKVMVYAKTEYVEQIDLEKYKKEITVFEYMESKNESWWDIVTMVEKIFDSNIVVTQPLNTLSGGEIIKLNICIALSQNPELILLDEPTNHLDLNSIEKLNKYIKNSNLTFVIVSHNIDFLDKTVNIIWEIDNKKLNVYGGNYSFFKSEKDKKIQAQLNRYEAMKKKVTRETKSLNTLQTKYQKGKSKLEKMAKTHDRSIPKKKRKTMMDGLQTGYGDIKSQKKKTLQTHIDQLK